MGIGLLGLFGRLGQLQLLDVCRGCQREFFGQFGGREIYLGVAVICDASGGSGVRSAVGCWGELFVAAMTGRQ